MNRNAYIQVAITSEPFCKSAMTACLLILKNAAKFGFLAGISNVFLLLGKVVIALATSCLAFLIMKSSPEYAQVESPVMPIVAVFVLSYTVGAIFVSVFTVSSNAIMQCFLVEVDIHGEKGARSNWKGPSVKGWS